MSSNWIWVRRQFLGFVAGIALMGAAPVRGQEEPDAKPARKAVRKKIVNEEETKPSKGAKKADAEEEGSGFGAGRSKKAKPARPSSDDKELAKIKKAVERDFGKGKGIFVVTLLEVNYERQLDAPGTPVEQPGGIRNRLRNDSAVPTPGQADPRQGSRSRLRAPPGYNAVPTYQVKQYDNRDDAVNETTEYMSEMAPKSNPRKSSGRGRSKSAGSDFAAGPSPWREYQVRFFKEGDQGAKQAELYMQKQREAHPTKKRRGGG